MRSEHALFLIGIMLITMINIFLGRIWICWKKSMFEVTVLDKSN
jgi:hypothetical protein